MFASAHHNDPYPPLAIAYINGRIIRAVIPITFHVGYIIANKNINSSQ